MTPEEEYEPMVIRLIDQKYSPEEAEAIKANHRFHEWDMSSLSSIIMELKAMPNFGTEASRELEDGTYYRHNGKILLASCPFERESKRANVRILREGRFEITVGYARFLDWANKIPPEEVPFGVR